jgi:hypothetical protein
MEQGTRSSADGTSALRIAAKTVTTLGGICGAVVGIALLLGGRLAGWSFAFSVVHTLSVVDWITYRHAVSLTDRTRQAQTVSAPTRSQLSDAARFKRVMTSTGILSAAFVTATWVFDLRGNMLFMLSSALAAGVVLATRPLRTGLRLRAGYPTTAPDDGWQRRVLFWLSNGSEAAADRVLGRPGTNDPRAWWVVLVTVFLVLVLGAASAVVIEIHEVSQPAGSVTDGAVGVKSDEVRDSHSNDSTEQHPDQEREPVVPTHCIPDPVAFLEALLELGVEATVANAAAEAWFQIGAAVIGCPYGVQDEGENTLILLTGAPAGDAGIFVSGGMYATVVHADELPIVQRRLARLIRIEPRLSSGVATNQWLWLRGENCTVIARPVRGEEPTVPPSAVAMAGLIRSIELGGVPESFTSIAIDKMQVWEMTLRVAARDPNARTIETIRFDPETETAEYEGRRIASPGCPSDAQILSTTREAERLWVESEALGPGE